MLQKTSISKYYFIRLGGHFKFEGPVTLDLHLYGIFVEGFGTWRIFFMKII